MVQTKKFEQSFVNEYMAWNLHDQDVERRGKEIGRQEGQRAARAETALRMLSMGLPLETVSQATGLSLDSVKRLLP